MTPHHAPDHSPSPEQLVEELAARHRHVAVLAAHDVLGDWTLAEDAAQLAFLFILKRLRAGDTDLLDDNPEAAVRRNARWAAMKLRRRSLRRAEAEQRHGEENVALGPDHCARTEARLACETLLGRLPDHYRDAIGMRFFRDLSDGDAAARLDVTLRAYRRRLDRAMAAARSTAQALGIRGAAALLGLAGALRGLLRRSREHVAELTAQLTGAWSGAAVNATALVVLGGTAATPASVAFTATSAPAPAVAATVAAGARVSSPERATALATATQTQTPRRPVAAPQAAGPNTAWNETLEDSQISSAAAAPGPDGRGATVVALGWGKSCACPVVFQSADAGRSWVAAPGPDLGRVTLAGLTVSLPPAYPADPRIFLGAPWLGSLPDMVADRFGGGFRVLPMTGFITLPQSFESDGTMLFSQLTAVVQLRLGASTAAPLVFQPPLVATPVVGAPRSGPDGVFVLSDQEGWVSAPGPSTGVTRPVLYRCDAGAVCNAVASVPIASVDVLAISDRYADDRAVAVASGDDVALSRDAGSSFTHLPDPSAPVASLEVTSDARGPVVWATLTGAVGHGAGVGIARWDAAHGWVNVLPIAQRDFFGRDWPAPLLLDADHALLRAASGLLCTADGGRSWASRCP